jgi:uncharacterized repeat protein (TIGR03837 family)
VRLFIDDASALAWMAPGALAGRQGVEVQAFEAEGATPGDVVIEAFGCNPPVSFVERMAAAARPALWINLEHLSAEDYVERSHGLPSPQLAGAGRGLTKWFFYPGFTPRSGGLIREADLDARLARFDRGAWLAQQGLVPLPGERLVCLFGYAGAPWQALLPALAGRPGCLLVPPGPLQEPIRAADLPAGLRCHPLPWLSQSDFDHLLWSCDLNAVRGEDSVVRALWAGRPLLWQLYPQHDGAHEPKLAAFARRCHAGALQGLEALWRHWNGLDCGPLQLPDEAAWQRFAAGLRDELAAGPELVSSLQSFAAAKLGAAG